MQIQGVTSNNGNDLLISVQGRFDFNGVSVFRDTYEQLRTPPKSYTIDFKETEFLDSSALGTLLSLRTHAMNTDAKVKIINANPDVQKILKVTKLDQLFLIQ